MVDNNVVNERYQILRLLGEGAQGRVFAVRDLSRPETRPIALKVLRADYTDQDVARLADEFRHLALVEGSSFVRVYDLARVSSGPSDVPRGALFLTEELIEGWFLGRGLPPMESKQQRNRFLWQLLHEASRALAALHAHGIVHGDLKPGNVAWTRAGFRLLDLGLARPRGLAAGGTPGFAAPEVLAGVWDPRSDLYSLGATVYWLCAQRCPRAEPGASHEDLLAATLYGRLLPLKSLAPWVSESLDRVVQQLLEADPERRPQSAEELAELAAASLPRSAVRADHRRQRLLPTRLVGRQQELARLHEILDEASADGPRVVFVSGPPGSGRRRLIREFLLRLRLHSAAGLRGRADPPLILEGDWPSIRTGLAAVGTPTSPAHAGDLPGPWRHGRPTVLAITEELSPDAEPFLQSVVLLPGQGPLLVLVRVQPDSPLVARLASQPRVHLLELRGLGPKETASLVAGLLGSPAAPGRTALVHKLTSGLPGLVQRLCELALEATGRRTEALSAPLEELAVQLSQPLPEVLPEASRRLLAALHLVSWRQTTFWLPVQVLECVGLPDLREALERLAALGLVALEPGRVRLQSTAAGRAALDACPAAERNRLRNALLDSLEARLEAHRGQLAELQVQLALARLSLGSSSRARRRKARQLAAEAARAARDHNSVQLERQALEIAIQAGHRAFALRARLADLLARAGALDEALETLSGPWPKPRDALRASARRARFLRRQGRLEEALEALEVPAHAGPLPEEDRLERDAELMRCLVELGRVDEALRIAGDTPEPPHSPSHPAVAWLESAGLAHLFAGDLATALERFESALALARRLDDPALVARCLGLLGMAHQEKGDWDAALAAYEAAAKEAESARDLHGLAIYLANQGSLLHERGRLDEAVQVLDRAARLLEGLGNLSYLGGVLSNLGHALLGVGLYDAAADAALRALARGGSKALVAHALLLVSELLCRGVELPDGLTDVPQSASEAALKAAELFASAGVPDRALWARAQALLAQAVEGTQPDQLHSLAAQLVHAASSADPVTRGVVWQLVARASNQVGKLLVDELPVAEARRLCRELEGRGATEQAWRLAAQVARAVVALRGELSPEAVELARYAHETLKTLATGTRGALRPGRLADPDAVAAAHAAALLAGNEENEEQPMATRSPVRTETSWMPVLRRLLHVSRVVAEHRRLEPVLQAILDAALDLTGAERGLVLLDEDGDLVVRASRNISVDADRQRWSQSIARKAMEEQAPVLTVDAAADERFVAAASIADLRLRSVLAVPMLAAGRPVGTLYVDSRVRRNTFTPEHADVALALADQAAVAIELARLLEDNERHRREIETLNARLRQALDEARDRLALAEQKASEVRHQSDEPFEGMVAVSAAMREVFHLVERVAPTGLPVVILGESGTGKELVARAIHARSGRTGTFASENCGAVPETLLESILFGHEKGAFTGATRRHRGLFEVAHGGTLFLDELEEMSQAMQVKLLRVLQEGKFRRLGGEEDIAVDVRIVAASNQDLDALVREGRFRQDLFYRINVVRITLPPLRDRPEDIPVLVSHFLSKYGRPDLEISSEAMECLLRYHWPGNVRQLENEMMRLAALCGETVRPADLSPELRELRTPGSRPSPGEREPQTWNLKAQVEALERRLIQQALERTQGNKSRAAKLLGVSRYGLQKMMARLGLT